MIKKLLLTIFFLSFTICAFAENFYVINTFKMQARSGNVYEMGIVTKCGEKNTAQVVMKAKSTPWGRWISTSSDIVSGPDNDKLFERAFKNLPTSELYISFTDLDGHETRINFMGLPIIASSPIANAMVNQFRISGIKNVKIVYPEK